MAEQGAFLVAARYTRALPCPRPRWLGTAAARSLDRGGALLKVSPRRGHGPPDSRSARQRRFLLHLYEVGVHALKANDLPAQWFPLLHIVERVVQSRRLRWPAKSRLRGCGCTTV